MEWYNHLSHDCPPSDAEPAKGKFYRLIKKEHTCPRLEDFRSWREEHVGEQLSSEHLSNGITECQACGLSVWPSLDDARRSQRRVPAHRRGVPAQGSLTPDLGLVKHTPPLKAKASTHHTWWPRSEVKPWEFFQIVDTTR